MAPTPETQLRIAIGENNEDLATTLQLLLETEPGMSVIGTGSSSREIKRIAATLNPNAFILDLSLDDGSSMPLIGALRTQTPEAVIIVFTGHSLEMVREHCLRAGADEVVVKNSSIEELVAALRRAAKRTN
jgi:DNA-binding NarL/FixJ family response regulator